ncbi:MAG: DNA repair protein RecO [Saccharofermentanales bacterium]|jgi:DNA repair protein RecO (recombination protein O)
MPYLKVKGFVIREVPVGDADRIINILTADHGLITASARGARRTRSALLMSTQIFSLSNFEIFINKGHYRVNSAELIEAFLSLHQDIDRLVCAAHLAEVLLDCTRDAMAQPELYHLWAYTMQALQTRDDPMAVTHIAQLRMMAEIGFAPRSNTCVICGNELQANPLFSIQSCGTVCTASACRNLAIDARVLSSGVLECLKHSLTAPFPRLYNVRLGSAVRSDFFCLSTAYLSHQMEKAYTRLNMLTDLQASGQA